MSLILEALRKSEAERRRGQVPDLHAAPSPGAQPLRGRPPAWFWPSLALATAVALAIALWLARSEPSPRSAAIDVPVAANGLSAGRSVDSDGDTSRKDESISSAGPPGVPDVRPNADAIPALMPRPGRQPDVAHVATAPSPAEAAATTATPPVSAPARTVAAAPAPAPPRPPSAVAVVPAHSAVPDAVMSASAAVAPAVSPAVAPGVSPLRLSELSVAQRQQLPPLKMSMHMYSPTQRFAIIDGTRVAEGDRIGGAVVEEITSKGVVLDWQGQRLQIPIR